MDISRTSDAARSAPLRSDTFTGDVWGEPLIGRPPDIVVNHVLFSPAARTHWHRHEGGQILHITQGRGRVRARGGAESTVTPGDAVWIPPGEEHYHGADLDHFMSHVSISFGATAWLEPAEDREYGVDSD